MDYDFSFYLVVGSFLTGLIWGGHWLYCKVTNAPYPPEKEPVAVEYSRSFFPVILIVLLLRAFLFEPFRIPSGSMMPTLLIGDFILVNKFSYGMRLPVLNTKIVEIDEPKRGDIVVFRYPRQPSIDYIKRVIGLPGDRIGYWDKTIYVNGQATKQVSIGRYLGVGQGANMTGAEELIEDLNGIEHSILINRGFSTGRDDDVFVVPPGHYFVMGDNRDNSNDSRFWGTVPEANLVGKAIFIWMNLDFENKGIDFSRIGTLLK
jgi:signal peptidase I